MLTRSTSNGHQPHFETNLFVSSFFLSLSLALFCCCFVCLFVCLFVFVCLFCFVKELVRSFVSGLNFENCFVLKTNSNVALYGCTMRGQRTLTCKQTSVPRLVAYDRRLRCGLQAFSSLPRTLGRMFHHTVPACAFPLLSLFVCFF